MARLHPLLALALGLATAGVASAGTPSSPGCKGTLYLSFDTGNMRDAELIADTLARHGVKATFFLAQEKTTRGDSALDASWAPYWRARVAEGHAFGSHTWRHGSFRADSGKLVRYRLQDGSSETLDAAAVCAELQRPDTRFQELTGRRLDPLWRAPGGRTTPNTLAAAQACGYRHVGWATAGFLGDELPSETHPNPMLLQRALERLRDGDIVMAHLGIWSRKDPFAPMFEPLIAGLKAKGFCFATRRGQT
ncbi:MAG TPA: polysaccharide deacetylase family protein [Candidatus Accumulibacter phosphatis]|nr:MAG: delta-lactam-biosynthetic de-N-acetylase [Candidatus Accumulibacter sp. SK-11]HAY27507.1 polysaccharide deacetylase family protein [Accumulibacter sp.]HRL77490.1 polysaccharide deacetylase family protein [Candidatus Accumulibacter phosphatis]HCN70119.1 polysaccharide deacetylase family protein [Accumulibacter sp.]HCV14225.1 polysaccharide deacetylase family protein [Accumulibacter sp.]